MTTSKLRWSDLSGNKVIRLYNAVSFAQWQFGPNAVFNTHITILWEEYGIKDHELAARLLGKYLNAAEKWAKVGMIAAAGQRWRARTGEGFIFRHVYTHENSGQRGFHSHVLTTLPRPAIEAFTAWTYSILRQLTKEVGTLKSVQVKVKFENSEGTQVERGWTWFRYITKQCAEAEGLYAIQTGQLNRLRDVLRLWPHQSSLPVTCAKLSGTSQDIGVSAQRRSRFLSTLLYGNPGQIYDGHELEQYRERLRERERTRMMAALNATIFKSTKGNL